MFALVDGDAVRTHLDLVSSATDEKIIQKAKQACPTPDLLSIHVLNRNVEDLIKAASACRVPASSGQFERAITKNRVARDLVLNKAAESAAEFRICMRKKVPSFDAFVQALAQALGS